MSSESQTRLWVRGDLNGFFGLFTNSLANTLTTIFLVSVVLGFPKDLVFGKIVPGLVLSLAFGNIYFAWQAWRLGKKEGRGTVTAVPYGLSVPHYFIVVFGVMLPLFLSTDDANLAWSVGVAWCFVHAVVAAIGAFVGPTLRKVTPRAAMLGTLAGVAITFIAMGPAFQVWQVAWLGMISLGLIFIGWLANVDFPFKIPAGLLAVIVGVILGWATGYMKVGPLQEAVSDLGVYIPLPQLQPLLRGLPLIAPYLVSAIPLAIYLFLESLNNVESAFAGGDDYNTTETMLAAAGGTLIASLFGSPFPTLVYIGHPGWKSVGARVGYSWGTGVAMLLLGVLGLLSLLLNIIPIVAILPILIYIGMVITSQSFTATPARHAPAVAIAIVPWLASWAQNQIDNALGAAGTSAAQVGYDTLAGSGVTYQGMAALGAGAILVGMILAAIVAYIIDKNYRAAIGYAIFGAACSWFGVIHASQFQLLPNASASTFSLAFGPPIGYLAIAGICLGMFFYTRNQPGAAPEEAAVAAE